MKTTDDIRVSILRGLRLLLLILAPFASARAASPVQEGTTLPTHFKVHNEVLGKVPLLGDSRSTVVSDDAQHLAFVVRRAQGWTVWHDGVEGPTYQRIRKLLFSPLGAHLAYIAAKTPDADVVVLDGKELATRTSISTNSLHFSPDGKRIAYVFSAPTNRAVTIPPRFRMLDGELTQFGAYTPLSVVVDGQPGREYRGIGAGQTLQPSAETGTCGPAEAPHRGQYGVAISVSRLRLHRGHRPLSPASCPPHPQHTSGRTRSRNPRAHVRPALAIAAMVGRIALISLPDGGCTNRG